MTPNTLQGTLLDDDQAILNSLPTLIKFKYKSGYRTKDNVYFAGWVEETQ